MHAVGFSLSHASRVAGDGAAPSRRDICLPVRFLKSQRKKPSVWDGGLEWSAHQESDQVGRKTNSAERLIGIDDAEDAIRVFLRASGVRSEERRVGKECVP